MNVYEIASLDRSSDRPRRVLINRPSGDFDCDEVASLIDADETLAPSKVGRVLTAIAGRLKTFSPKIILNDHIDGHLEVCGVAGEGIYFKPRNASNLKAQLRRATRSGETAFADPNGKDRHNLPLCLSMAATNGQGFREIQGWATMPYAQSELAFGGNASYERMLQLRFSGAFGDDHSFDLQSLHIAVAHDVVNIHVDTTGFTMRGFDGLLATTPDAGQHTGNELLWKTYIKTWMPDSLGFLADRISFIWPNSANGYQVRGPSLGAAGRFIGKVPAFVQRHSAFGAVTPTIPNLSFPTLSKGGLGGKVESFLLNDIPVIPGGMTVDLKRIGATRLEATLTWNDGSRVDATLNLRGRW